MGIYTATFDAVSLRRKIGPEIHHIDQWLLIKRIEEVAASKAEAVADELTREWKLGPNVTRAELVKAGRMAVALRELAAENHLDAINIKCHYELSEIYQFTACVPISILSKDIVCSCEGDMFATMSQLMLHYLTGNQTVYGDIHEVFPPDRLTIACCGFNPIGMCDPNCRMISRWASNFQGIMNSSPYQTDQRVTLARMAAKGEGLQAAPDDRQDRQDLQLARDQLPAAACHRCDPGRRSDLVRPQHRLQPLRDGLRRCPPGDDRSGRSAGCARRRHGHAIGSRTVVDEALVLGLDLGISTAKAALFSPDGIQLALESEEYLILPEGDRVEADPEVYWNPIVRSLRRMLGGGAATRSGSRPSRSPVTRRR